MEREDICSICIVDKQILRNSDCDVSSKHVLGRVMQQHASLTITELAGTAKSQNLHEIAMNINKNLHMTHQ